MKIRRKDPSSRCRPDLNFSCLGFTLSCVYTAPSLAAGWTACGMKTRRTASLFTLPTGLELLMSHVEGSHFLEFTLPLVLQPAGLHVG